LNNEANQAYFLPLLHKTKAGYLETSKISWY